MNKQSPDHIYPEPLKVTRVGSAVVILGPDAVAISITPDAARTSARLLQAAADDAAASGETDVPILPIEQE